LILSYFCEINKKQLTYYISKIKIIDLLHMAFLQPKPI